MIGTTLLSTDSYNNPFEEINANVIDPKSIVEYWCNPFESGVLTPFDEHKFRTSKVPIILQGSRGTGKTTILKYYSFPAQSQRTALLGEQSILKRIQIEEEVGFYFRCEESFVSTFTSIFKSVNSEYWTKCFECYIELVYSEKILDMVSTLQKRGEVASFPKSSIKKILSRAGIKDSVDCQSIDMLFDLVHENVIYFEQYKNMVMFNDEQFCPLFFVDIFSLSSIIVKEIKDVVPEFRDVLFVFMVDEYENLEPELQKRFNSIIKFIKEDISVRIGRRREGAFTTETVNDVEYLRENHDYYLASLDTEQNINVIRKYFREVAKRRYQKTDHTINEYFDIAKMLGDKEDLVEECLNVCGHKKTHLEVVLKQSDELSTSPSMIKEIVDIIQNDENPIAETINALWVLRSKKNSKLEMAKYAANAMKAFFEGSDVEGVSKYKDDYSNKYRYAITVFICSVYKKDKQYYGFNALSHLSNGNVRTFINFCQSIINDALFYEKDTFLKTGIISKQIQSNAIRRFARSEFDSICSVVYAGERIKRLVSNLGNTFSVIHKDKKIRYPETTQFAFDKTQLYLDDKDVLGIAESWALIIKRHKEQRVSVGLEEKMELYHINKMFTPLFNISYRIRGGVNIMISPEQMHLLLNKESFIIKQAIESVFEEVKDTQTNIDVSGRQLTIFDMGLKNE